MHQYSGSQGLFFSHLVRVLGGTSDLVTAPKGLAAKNRKIIVGMGSVTRGGWKAIPGEGYRQD